MKNNHLSPVIKNKTAAIFHKVMLIAMLHNTFIAPCQTIVIDYFTLEKPRHYSGAVLNSSEIFKPEIQEDFQYNIPSSVLKPVTGHVYSNQYTGAPQLRNTIEHASFEADIKEGSIGVTPEHPLDSPTDNLFKFNIEDRISPLSRVYLTYELYGVQDASAVSRSINDRLSTGGHLVKYQPSWTSQKEEIDGTWLQPGENKVLFTIAKGASYQYKVRNIRIEVDNATEKALASLVIYQPTIRYTHNNQMYVKGFVKNAAPDAKVYIEDNPLSVHDGAFEGTIALTETIKNRHFVVVKAIDSKGLVGQEIIMLDEAEEADRLFPIEENMLSSSLYFKADEAGSIAIDGAVLEVKGNALKLDKNITATRLRAIDVPPMSSGMINVTKGGTAYRFLPDGTVFDEPVSLSLAYDEKLIPPGHNAKEIHTYYFNTNSKTWMPVIRDSVIEKDKMIISRTNHFTDYINGIIQTPESPETAAFTPTMMSDIKAADPSAEMTIISPPEVSQKGDANISYPIKIPAGTRGMQPSLAVQYSNEGGNGWVGQGWGLNIPAISIDTKWGVPLLDDTFETEVYTLAGEQLMYPKIQVGVGVYDDWMPNRHYGGSTYSTEPRNRTADLIFTPRKQGSFATVQRMGSSPETYFWKVTATDGSISWYGGKTGVESNAVLKRGNKIVYWALYMTEDVHGNYVKYEYFQDTLESGDLTPANSNLLGGKIFLPLSISYSGHGNPANFGYKINFKKTTSIKDDATINARLGVKQVDAYLLSEIEVFNLKTEPQYLIRKYKFGYNPNGGRFKKAQLISLGEYIKDENNNDKEFYSHKFEYYNDIPSTGNNVFFSAGVDVNVCNDDYEAALDSDGDGIYDENDCESLDPPCPSPQVPQCYEMTFPMPLTDIIYKYNMNFGATIPLTEGCTFTPYRIKNFQYGLNTGATIYPAPSPNNNLYLTHFDGNNVVNLCQGGGFFTPVNPVLPNVLESWLSTTFSAMPITDFSVSNHSNVMIAGGQGSYNIVFGVGFLSAFDNINFGCKLESAQANNATYTTLSTNSTLSHYIHSGTGVSVGVSISGAPLGTYNFQTGLNAFIADFHELYPDAEITTQDFNVIITIPNTTANLSLISMNVGGANHSFDLCGKEKGEDRPANVSAYSIEEAREKLFDAAFKTKDKAATARTANDDATTYIFNNGYPIGPQECPSFLNTEFIVQGIIPSFNSSAGILGSTLTESLGASLYIGAGLGCKPHTKSITFGKQWSASKDKTNAKIGMADINGDGLDDMVIRQENLYGAALFYKPHKIERTYNQEGELVLTHSFGNKRPIIGMTNFYKSTGKSESQNLQVTFGVSKVGGFIGRDKAESEATTNVYFTDGNGDGLIDIVRNGLVYFNHLDANGNPSFTLDSADTENLVIKAKPMQIDEPAPAPSELNIPDYDVVKVWEAPASGNIRIENAITLTDTSKEAVITIEKEKGVPVVSQCYMAEFTVPYQTVPIYHYLGVHSSAADSTSPNPINPSVEGDCYGAARRIKYLVLNGNNYNNTIITPPNPNPLFYVHGNAVQGVINQCPNYLPGIQTDPVIQSADSETIIGDWLDTVALVDMPHTGFTFGNGSGIRINSQNKYENLYYYIISFYSTISDFEGIMRHESTLPGYPSYWLDLPLPPVGDKMSVYNTQNTISGLDTNVYINGVLLPGGPFNLVDDFLDFKTAFETQYGITMNFFENVPNNGTSYTFNVYASVPFNSISFVPVDAPEDITTFTFDVTSQCDGFRESGKSAIVSKSLDNVKLSEEAKMFAMKKWEAAGNALKSPLLQPEEKFSFDLIGKTNSEIKKTYCLTVKELSKLWTDVNNAEVKDTKLISELNALIPAGFEAEVKKSRNAMTEKILAKNKESQIKAQQWLDDYYAKKKQSKTVAETNYSTARNACSEVYKPLGVLFGDTLNSTHTTINNTIDHGTTALNTAGTLLNVRKGERIYFRVHANDGANPLVNWTPKVVYTDTAMAAATDQNGQLLYDTNYSDGFLLSKYDPVIVPDGGYDPANGNAYPATATISWPSITVTAPSDDVIYEIHRITTADHDNGSDNITDTVIYRKICKAGQSTTVSTALTAGLGEVNLLSSNTNMASNLVGEDVTNSNQFYFKVFSSSNVKWKDYKWSPKIACVTQQPMIGDAGTSEGTLTSTTELYPNVDYSIYKSYPCAPQYSLFNTAEIPATDLEIKPIMNHIFNENKEVSFWFVVKNNGKAIVKKKFTRSELSPPFGGYQSFWDIGPNAVPLGPLTGTNIEIGFYFDDSVLLDDQISNAAKLTQSVGAVRIYYNNNNDYITVTPDKLNIYHKPNPKFGPMLRQWGQFMYSPGLVTGATSSPYGDIIEQDELIFTTAQLDAVQDAMDHLPAENTPIDNVEAALDNFNLNYGGVVNSLPLLVANPSRKMVGNQLSEKWIGQQDNCFGSETGFKAARMEELELEGYDPEPYDFQLAMETGAYAINKKTKGRSKNLSAGASVDAAPGLNVGINGSKTLSASSKALTDYVDFNGDRYPDIISSDFIQFTESTGGLRDKTIRNGNVSESTSSTKGFGASGSFSKGGDQDGMGTFKFIGFKGNSGGGISGNFSKGDSTTGSFWADMNGDGLSDFIERVGSDVTVKLSTGTVSTDAGYTWLLDKAPFDSKTENRSAGVGVNKWNGSFEAGVSVTSGWNSTDGMLIDMNGDGLMDYLSSAPGIEGGMNVMLNQGNNFVDFGQQWSTRNLKRESVVVGSSINLGFTVAITWPIFLGLCIKFPAVNIAGTPESASVNKTMKSIRDFDGDGYPDIVEQDDNNSLKVYSSTIGRTDMLKTVKNPIGGSFTIDYKVQPINYDNPQPKWVMTDLEINDGYNKQNDGRDKYRKHFVYENGKYDRREREFYGYETVKSVDYLMDEEDKPTTVYRTSVSKYHNDSYFLNGLVKETYIYKGDNENQKYSATENTYEIRSLDETNSHINLEDDPLPMNYDVGGTEGRHTAVVLLVKIKNLLYELAEDPQLTTVTNLEYDSKGRIVTYSNIGNIADASDDYISEITYHDMASLQAKNILRVPQSITVSGGSTTYRSRSTIVDPDNGNVLVVNAVLDDQNTAAAQMQYDEYGNMTKITYPPNLHNQSMTYDYEYDPVYHKYVVEIKDAYNYVSSALYNSNFDKVREVRDISGNYMIYKYDRFGRTTEVISPYELKDNKPYTIKFEYFPTYQVVDNSIYKNCFGGSSEFTPFAITSHYDKQGAEGNDIQTVTFIDGLSRVIQVKKDIQLIKSGSPYEAMSSSGNITFDDFGRVIRAYHPTARDKDCNKDLKYVEYESEFSSLTEYDQIDRTIKATDADGNSSFTSYSIDTDTDGTMAIKTRSVTEQGQDNQSIISESYKNTSGKLIATMNAAPGNDLWTKFRYDHIGQLLSYEDADAILTSYVYDKGGRKKSINHPDNGLTKIEYDNAGHMITAQTANLAADITLNEEDRFIKYDYYYNRAIAIKYPDTQSGLNLSNVTYVYGDVDNNAGKVIEQHDASGDQYFNYGLMGEVIYNERVVVGPNIPTRNFKTYFTYDSWNRLISLKYPDNEEVNYKYDFGGNLRSMTGSVDGSDYPYIRSIDYDLYEQRTDVSYGNGTENHYTYKASTRRLDRLKALTSSNEVMFNNTYQYDYVGNVTGITNNEGPLSNQFGGTYSHTFKYDSMSRLKEATGVFDGNPGQASNSNDYQSDYRLEMTYNKTNGIDTKVQVHHKNMDMTPYAPNSYDNTYKYYAGTHKLERISDQSLNTEEEFDYDLNGNMVSRVGTDSDKSMWWDESNRLRVFMNNNTGEMQHYIYDATGQRVLKANTNGESVYNNGSLITPYSVTVNGYTTYASGFLVIDPFGVYSKHYYAGGERVVSRIGGTDLGIFSTEIPRGTADGEQSADVKLRKAQIADLQRFADKLKLGTVKFAEFKAHSYSELQQAMKEDDDSDAPETQQRAESPSGPLYFYHPDHLGTTTFLTDQNGNAYQFFLNLPFGETMAQQNPLSSYKSPYLFNGKELDEETGMYYYGARFYDPKVSIWMSVDPMSEEAPNFSVYCYTFNNPINFTDPDGRWPDWGSIKRTYNETKAKLSRTYNEAKASVRRTYNEAKATLQRTYNEGKKFLKTAYNDTKKFVADTKANVKTKLKEGQQWVKDNKKELLKFANDLQDTGDTVAYAGYGAAVVGSGFVGVGAAPGLAVAAEGEIIAGAGSLLEIAVLAISGDYKADSKAESEFWWYAGGKVVDEAIDRVIPGPTPGLSDEAAETIQNGKDIVQKGAGAKLNIIKKQVDKKDEPTTTN